MVNACAILVGTLFTRYVGINDRLRSMSRERLDALRQQHIHTMDAGERGLVEERVREIDAQIPNILYRHRLAHHAVVAIYVAVCLFIADMFIIALSVTTDTLWASPLALLVFLAGMAVMLFSIIQTVREVSRSRGVVIYEVERVMSLTVDDVES